jgi:hypothetical protein
VKRTGYQGTTAGCSKRSPRTHRWKRFVQALEAGRRPATLAEQELLQAVAGVELIALGGLAGAHQISQDLMRRIGDPHRSQVTTPEAPGELRGIAPVGLDAVAGLHGYQRGGQDDAPDPELRELPVQGVAAGARFVARPQGLGGPELADQLPHGLVMRNDAQRADCRAAGTACADAQVTTLRERLLKLAVWVERSVRRIVLHWPASFPWLPTWRRIARAVGATP